MKENVRYVEEILRDSLRSQSVRTYECNCNGETPPVGRLLWRIEDFNQKMKEAKEQDTVIYSPKFLDKEYGYTLRMELYLNGLGQWKKRHIIGCLRIVDGKWDPLLEWPCVLKADVTLKDQEDSKNDVKKFVKTMKVGKDVELLDHQSELHMFIPHTTLNRYSGYTKDSVMFLDIKITKISESTMSLV